MANKERLLQLADVIEAGHKEFNGIKAIFNMAVALTSLDPSDKIYLKDYLESRTDLSEPTIDKCNTAACMAGFACLVFDYDAAKEHRDEYTYNVLKKARELLELTEHEAEELFETNTSTRWTGPEVAAAIRRFANTGIIEFQAKD